MKKSVYDITIKAPTRVVWKTLILPELYEDWAKAFSENSRFDGSWVQGAEIKFTDSERGGTRATLDVVQPEKRIFIRHIALINKAGEESTTGEIADKWLGTTEEYRLEETSSGTKLTVEILTHADFVAMSDDAWSTALSRIAELSENNA